MSPAGKVTIRDVANQAGVSISSVSRALSGHPYVSDELRQRVEEAARALGYQPDFRAHSLRRGTTLSVGFLVGSLSNPVVADLSNSAANVLASLGYTLALVCSQNRAELDEAYLRFLAQRQVDGLIVSSATEGPERANRVITQLGIPTVMLDRALPAGDHVSAVQSDHVGGMYAAVTHLLAQGHRRIAFIGGPSFFYPAQQRLAGFYAALEDAGIAPEPGLIRAVGMEEEVGYREARALFSRPDPPRALIAGGNLVLIGILRAVQELGIVIGRDLALIGCDDTDLTRIYHPPITVIHRDLAQMGAMAARVLVDTMQKGGRQVVQLPTQLVIRASSLVPGP